MHSVKQILFFLPCKAIAKVMSSSFLRKLDEFMMNSCRMHNHTLVVVFRILYYDAGWNRVYCTSTENEMIRLQVLVCINICLFACCRQQVVLSCLSMYRQDDIHTCIRRNT